ncbi:MAG: FkbM family methyltransferase [Holosporaceae bacterium]|jgi:FkbM family methyltransferase|nr:FkbM family methyltransferase [Holosporaceae bacterium]
MEQSFSPKESFLSKNKIVVFSVVFACIAFVATFFIEKSQISDFIPSFNEEISLENNFIITIIKNKYPILIKKDDPFVESCLRVSGDVKSLFSETAISLCKENDIVAEVGAHFGYNSINIGMILKKRGKYYAFEANAGVCSCLRKNIILNDLENVVFLKNTAISDREGTFDLEDCMSIVRKQNGNYTKPRLVTVSCNTLDKELAREIKPISMLLIDIPGNEFSIIKGARNIIDGSPNIKLVVSFDKTLSFEKFNVKKELENLQEKDFRFYIAEAPNEYVYVTLDEVMSKEKAVLIMARGQL